MSPETTTLTASRITHDLTLFLLLIQLLLRSLDSQRAVANAALIIFLDRQKDIHLGKKPKRGKKEFGSSFFLRDSRWQKK